MPKYSVEGNAATSTTLSTVAAANASAATQLRRMKHFFVSIGFSGTPGDVTIEMIGQRYTADGTPSAVTPTPLDPADAAALGVGSEDNSVEPTYAAGQVWLSVPVHQRNTLIFYAPENPFITPAADEDGLGWQADASSGTPNCTVTMHFEE